MLGWRGLVAPMITALVVSSAGCVKSRTDTPDDVRPKMIVTGQMMRSALTDPNLELPRDVSDDVDEAVWKAEVYVDANRSFSIEMAYDTDEVKACALVATQAGARILAGFPYADTGLAIVMCTAEVRAELEITEEKVVIRAGHGTPEELFGMVERERAAATASAAP